MVTTRRPVLVWGFGGGFSPVHTTLVVVSGRFGLVRDVSGSAVNGHGAVIPHARLPPRRGSPDATQCTRAVRSFCTVVCHHAPLPGGKRQCKAVRMQTRAGPRRNGSAAPGPPRARRRAAAGRRAAPPRRGSTWPSAVASFRRPLLYVVRRNTNEIR
jgi:hypothetical protein